MTPDGLKMLLETRTGYRISVRTNKGSMRPYLTFSIVAALKGDKPKSFDYAFRDEIEQLFPPIAKESGCFTSEWQIDVLRIHFNYLNKQTN